MYVLKNAFKSITRSKGRTILNLILIIVISLSACVALSIKNSADNARDITYGNLSVTASIITDRNKLMGGTKPDKDTMLEMMDKMQQSLSVEELEKYSQAESVKDFYYTGQTGLNGDVIEPYQSTDADAFKPSKGMGNMGGMGKMMSDFTIIGASSHNAMKTFIDGTNVITSGSVFEESDTSNNCVISSEVAVLNELEVGSTFTLVNPSKEDEVIEFTVCGIFECESTDSYSNQIYISYESLNKICEDSEAQAETITNQMTGTETTTALKNTVSGSYVLADIDGYESFQNEVTAMGLDTDVYTVSSSDITDFETSLLPLDNLSKFTMIFFWVVMAIGAVVLVIFNLFSIRERKYEMGVLAAIGMRKTKVAVQFLTEVFMVTIIAVIIGAGAGAAVSAPIGEKLLQNQIESVQTQNNKVDNNFGGGFSGKGNMRPGMQTGTTSGNNNIDYVDDIDIGTDFKVLAELMLMGIGLVLVSSSAGIISVLRYEPLKILTNRS